MTFVQVARQVASKCAAVRGPVAQVAVIRDDDTKGILEDALIVARAARRETYWNDKAPSPSVVTH